MKNLFVLMAVFSSLYVHAQWRTIYQDADTLNPEVAASFFTPANGFVATLNWIGLTADSGHSFQYREVALGNVNYGANQVNLTFGFGVSDIQAFGNNTLVVSGNYGWEPSILYSADGGVTWQLVYHRELGLNANFNTEYQMSFPGAGSTGYAVQNNEIVKTADGGQSWTTVYSANAGFFAVSATSVNTVYAAGPNVVMKTTNGGASWSTVTGPFAIQSMTAVSDQHLFVITTRGDCYSSIDGGATWQQTNSPTGQLSGVSVNGLHFVNDTTGYVCGNGIYQTRNSGKSWEVMSATAATRYRSYQRFFFYDSQRAWVGTFDGTLLLTTNGGGTTMPRALFDVNTSQVCATNTVQLLNQSQPGYTYAWYRNSVFFANTYNASYTTATGSDVIELIVSNGQQSDTSVQTVSATTASSIVLNVSPRQDTVCGDATLYFDISNSQTNIKYQVGRTCCGYTFNYPGNGGTLSIPMNLSPGEDSTSLFTVFAVKSDACGTDSMRKSFPVRILLPNPPISTLTDTICRQGTFYIRVTDSRRGYLYWADPARPVAGTGDTISLPCTINQESGYRNNDPYGQWQSYYFPVYISSTGAGCGPRSYYTASMVNRFPTPNFDLNGYTWFTGDTITPVQESTNAVSYQWKGGDGASFVTSNLVAPTLSFSAAGYKHIGLLAYSKEGCVDSIDKVITIDVNTGAVGATAICSADGRGDAVDSIQSNSYYVDRAIYEDEYGNRVLAGAFTSGGYPVGQEGWWAQKLAKNGAMIWSLSQPEFDAYYSYYYFPHIIIEQATGDSLGNTYLMGHAINQQYVTAIGESQTPIQRMTDFLIKVSQAGHIVWVKPFNGVAPNGTDPFCAGGSLLRGKGNTLYVITQRDPGYDYVSGGTTLLTAAQGHEGVIMEFNTDGNLLRINSFECPALPIYNPYIGTTDNYWHTPPATWVNGKLIVYTTLKPTQTTLENATIGFNSAQISSALAVFDTASLHAVNVLPLYSTLTGAPAGVQAETYAMDSTGAYYASFNGLVQVPVPAYPGSPYYDSLKGVTYIESFDPGGNLRWVKMADGLEPKRMIAFPGQLKVCGTNYAYAGWTTGWMIATGMQGPYDSTVKKLTSVGAVGSLGGSGGHGLGSLDIVVATLQSSDGQLIDYLPMGSIAEDEFSMMAKGAGNQLWVAGSVNAHWRSYRDYITGYALYTYKLPITNDCYGGYPSVSSFVRWNPPADTVTCTDSLYTVSWGSYGTGTLSIRFSTDSGAHFSPLVSGLAATAYSYTFDAVAAGTLGKVEYIISDDSSSLADTTIGRVSRSVATAVTLTADDTAICVSEPVHFLATPTNGGAAAVFHWTLDQKAIGSPADTLTLDTLRNMDKVWVSMIGSQTCSRPGVATSNVITVHVTTGVKPAVQISGAAAGIGGHTDTLYAHSVNAGPAPSFSWQDSTLHHGWAPIAGVTDSVLYYIPADSGDKVKSVVRGGVPCSPVDTAVSNVIVCSVVTPPPPPPPLPPVADTIGSGSFHLFPNPTYGTITIDTLNAVDGWQTLDILDINGRVVIASVEVAGRMSVTVSVGGLPNGVYYVRLVGTKKTVYLRCLKL